MVGRKPHRSRMFGERRHANRVRVVDQCAQQPVSFGQVTDQFDLLGRHPDIDELFEGAVWRHHAEGAVLGADQFDRHLDDSLEHHRQVEMRDDRLVGAQQSAKPPLRGQIL